MAPLDPKVINKKAKNGLSHIGVGTEFEGKLKVPHELSIHGKFVGEIECDGVITIGSKSVVNATINAKSAVISGKVEGNIICKGSIELEESAILNGNITASQLIINKGATFHGNSNMIDDTKKNKKIDVEL